MSSFTWDCACGARNAASLAACPECGQSPADPTPETRRPMVLAPVVQMPREGAAAAGEGSRPLPFSASGGNGALPTLREASANGDRRDGPPEVVEDHAGAPAGEMPAGDKPAGEMPAGDKPVADLPAPPALSGFGRAPARRSATRPHPLLGSEPPAAGSWTAAAVGLREPMPFDLEPDPLPGDGPGAGLAPLPGNSALLDLPPNGAPSPFPPEAGPEPEPAPVRAAGKAGPAAAPAPVPAEDAVPSPPRPRRPRPVWLTPGFVVVVLFLIACLVVVGEVVARSGNAKPPNPAPTTLGGAPSTP